MKYQNKKTGFTLVEMMVAIAVFSIVMVTAMSALLNVVDANNKARSIKTAINNISFALEGISKDMRVGTKYECSIDGANFTSDGNCTAGGTMIRYRSIRAYQDTASGVRKFAYYKFENSQIKECLEKEVGDNCLSKTFYPITSSEVTLNKVKFYILGNGLDNNGLKQQPRMIMTISGIAGSTNKSKLQTTFDLQTGVSQITRL